MKKNLCRAAKSLVNVIKHLLSQPGGEMVSLLQDYLWKSKGVGVTIPTLGHACRMLLQFVYSAPWNLTAQEYGFWISFPCVCLHLILEACTTSQRELCEENGLERS